MGVVVEYPDGSQRWCESCADPNDNGGSVVRGGTEHNAGGGQISGHTTGGAGNVGPGGNGARGTQAAQATAQDTRNYPSFYPGLNSSGGGYGGFNQTGQSGTGYGFGGANSAFGAFGPKGGGGGSTPGFGPFGPGGPVPMYPGMSGTDNGRGVPNPGGDSFYNPSGRTFPDPNIGSRYGSNNPFNPGSPSPGGDSGGGGTPAPGGDVTTPGAPGFNGFAPGSDQQNEWQFDPTSPEKSIANAMALLGLPSYGPMSDFFSRYGVPGVSQAIASGAFYNAQTFKEAMMNRMNGGGGNGMSSEDMVRALMSGESLANGISNNTAGTTNPTDAARAAYIGGMEGSPSSLANLLAGTLATGGRTGASTSIAGLLGQFLGNAANRRFNLGNSSNDTLGYLGNLLGFGGQ